MISLRTSMFSFRETYFRLVGLFDWGCARTQFLLLVSRNRYGFTLAGYQNEKSATEPALIESKHGKRIPKQKFGKKTDSFKIVLST